MDNYKNKEININRVIGLSIFILIFTNVFNMSFLEASKISYAKDGKLSVEEASEFSHLFLMSSFHREPAINKGIKELPPALRLITRVRKPEAKIITLANDKDSKKVALTFDDGPDSNFTPQVLDILNNYGVKGTFFILGSAANKNRDILKRIDEEGHEIGGHSWSHSNLSKSSESKIRDELRSTKNIIKEVVGEPLPIMRLPYGAFNKSTLNIIASEGYHNIYWTIDPRDWSGNSSETIENIIARDLRPGAIILLHSSGSPNSISKSVKALPNIIENIKSQGYEIVTITELLEDIIYEEVRLEEKKGLDKISSLYRVQ